jgi:hypothetical protein
MVARQVYGVFRHRLRAERVTIAASLLPASLLLAIMTATVVTTALAGFGNRALPRRCTGQVLVLPDSLTGTRVRLRVTGLFQPRDLADEVIRLEDGHVTH